MQADSENLITLMHQIRTLMSQLKPQSDITLGEFCVMSIIEDYSRNQKVRLTPTKLNDLLGTKKPATSRLLAVLEKKGYLVKSNDEKDHRICYLQLQPHAAEVLSEERKYFQQMFGRISMRVGSKEIIQLIKSIQKLSDVLEEELGENNVTIIEKAGARN